MKAVLALAGRRIDAPQADPARFPLSSVPFVTEQLRAAFDRLRVGSLVCSAACGSDLLALEIASTRAVDAYVVLPFDAERFRVMSVEDRPGDWNGVYELAIKRALRGGRLEILPQASRSDDDAYAAVNDRIVERACQIAGGAANVIAVAVWEGAPRKGNDMTARFLRNAHDAGVRTDWIPTLPQGER